MPKAGHKGLPFPSSQKAGKANPSWKRLHSDHPGSCQGQMTGHRPGAVGRPCWRWSTGSLEIWVLSSSQWGPRILAGAEEGPGCFTEPMGQGRRAWGRGLGKGNVASVCEKFPFGGKMWSLRGSQSNPTRGGKSSAHESKKDGRQEARSTHPRTSQSAERKTCFFYPGHRLPPQPRPTMSGMELPTPPPPRGKRWGEADTPPVHRPGLPAPHPLQRFLSQLPAPGGCGLGGPRAPAGGWLAAGASAVRRTFPSPPGAPGAWETFQAWLGREFAARSARRSERTPLPLPRRC